MTSPEFDFPYLHIILFFKNYMRILYLTEIFLPRISGYTVHVNNLASYFSRSNDVLVVTSSDKILPMEEKINSYKVKRLFSLTNPFNVDTKLSYLAVLKINKIIQDFQPDVIHIHDPAFISFFGAKYAKQNSIPVVYTQHASTSFPINFLPDMFRDLIGGFYEKFLSKFINENCDIVISPSNYISNNLKQIGVTSNKEIISNGIDLKTFFVRNVDNDFIRKYNLWENNFPTLLCVSRLSKEKNIDILFTVIKKIAEQKSINIIIIGDGEKGEFFHENFINNKQIKIFKEIKPNSDDLNSFYNYSDVFLIVSKNEAQSLVTMEAMACGLPVIANQSGALPELILNDRNGLLVKDDVNEYVSAINELIFDQNKIKKYKEKSLEIISAHDINESYKKIYNVYKQSVENQNKKKP